MSWAMPIAVGSGRPRGADALYGRLDGLRPGVFELQRERKAVAFAQGLFQPHEHHVHATGGELCLAAGRDGNVVDRPHPHHLAIADMRMELDALGCRRFDGEQPVTLGEGFTPLLNDATRFWRVALYRRAAPGPMGLD